MNMYGQNKDLPENIMLDKWADIGFAWSGTVPVSIFERLSSQKMSQEIGSQSLQVQVLLKKEQGILWLHFSITGGLAVTCQRCLDSMVIDVTDEYRLAILSDEQQIEQIQDAEYVLIEELGLGRVLPIKNMLEDELLLMLPLSPRHEACDLPIEMTQEDGNDLEGHPFAALQALKGRLN
ncbi:YceD family protein [Moraxella sp. Tifton1]|uniref:YceD family protein n=1 Tax=Moraxella oculi TaxID=2940516 RepID=UPI0020113B47|nr:YceD family protein [Moraxella sp. Tifton1]MCL1624056.1 YceD family protein [Moraxella sp. Tifton1]